MKEKTDWITNSRQDEIHTSGSQSGRKVLPKDRGLVKAAFAVIAGILIAALAKGKMDSDYYD